jgi:hypothetical protein
VLTTACPHSNRTLGRLIARNGAVHVVERCLDCGGNPRSFPFVPHGEVRVPLDSLPVLSDRRPAPDAPRQRGLFDGS